MKAAKRGLPLEQECNLNMAVLVTGGAGYVGAAVVEQLLAAGRRVVVLDDLSQGSPSAVPPGVRLVVGDIGDFPLVSELLEVERVSTVVHMAAKSIVSESVRDAMSYYHTNVVGTLRLMEAMLLKGVRRIVFSSTAAVYGDAEAQPIPESAPVAPTTPYGETKAVIERAIEAFNRAHGLQYTILRYFNAAGATQFAIERHSPETHLIPIVLEVAAKLRSSLSVYGDDYPTADGTCIRDYVHVEDIARAHVLALEAMECGMSSGTFNIGCGGEGYSVREVIESVRAVTGLEVPYQIVSRRAGDPPRLVASTDLIRSRLGWTPRRRGIDEIVASAWSGVNAHDR
jgi:UDP-glucose 4-epimerase